MDTMHDLPEDVPVSSRPFPTSSRMAVKTMLMDEVRASRRRRWQRPMIAGLATALAGTGIAAGSYIAFRQPTELRFAQCYTSVTSDINYRTTLAIGAAQRDDTAVPSLVEVTDALGACGNLWSQGALRAGSPVADASPNASASYTVPDLVACTLPDATVGIYPGDDSTCKALNLPSATRP